MITAHWSLFAGLAEMDPEGIKWLCYMAFWALALWQVRTIVREELARWRKPKTITVDAPKVWNNASDLWWQLQKAGFKYGDKVEVVVSKEDK